MPMACAWLVEPGLLWTVCRLAIPAVAKHALLTSTDAEAANRQLQSSLSVAQHDDKEVAALAKAHQELQASYKELQVSIWIRRELGICKNRGV